MPDDIRKIIETAPEFTPLPAEDDGEELSQRDKLTLCGMEGELWHDADHVAYATVTVDEHMESYALKSSAYRRHLLAIYGRRYPRFIGPGATIPGSPSSQAITDAMNSLEAIACAGPQKATFVRIGEHNGNVVLDLGTPEWSAVVIGPDGWRIVARPPVPFIRPAGLRPLPAPVKGGKITELRRFVNVADDGDFMLTVAFLLAALKRNGPFPIAVVNGEQGSAKSTFCRVLRRLVDPNAADLRSPPKDERDTLIAATNGWILGYDNLSYIDGEQSDWFCRIATGGGFATRALYSNGEEFLINVCRPVLLNGIPSLSSRPDLADRAVALTLPAIPENGRQSEGAFWTTFNEAAPRILGALLDGVAMALQNLPTVKLPRLPRMADFALWSVAAFPAYGWTADDFLAAYEDNRQRGVEDALEADPLAAAVREIVAERREYIGTATALLAEINNRVAPEICREKTWPKDAARLSNRLRRVAPALRRLGVEIDLDGHIGRGAEKKRAIQIRRAEPGALNRAGGDAANGGAVPNNTQQYQIDKHNGEAVDAGDADRPLSSRSGPWETRI
jgi:hypothetical protein